MKKIISIVSIIVFIITVPVLIYFGVGKIQQMRSKAAPASALSVRPASGLTNFNVGDKINVNVYINTSDGTNQNTVNLAEVILNYDQNILETSVAKIVEGNFFPKDRGGTMKDDVTSVGDGKIHFVSYTSTSQGGEGILATIEFTALAAGSTTIDFDQTNSQVIGLPDRGNVLSDFGALNLTIGSAGTSTTPTPTVTGAASSPTPTTTGTASSPTPTVTGAHSPTPTVTGQHSPTPSPTGSSNPTSSPTPTPTTAPGSTPNLTVTSLSEGATTSDNTPTLTGTSKAGSTITLHFDTTTEVVTANSSGVWTYTPTTALSEGQHTVTITETATDGTTRSAQRTFTVLTSAPPTSGSVETTLLILGIAVLFLTIGGGLTIVGRREY